MTWLCALAAASATAIATVLLGAWRNWHRRGRPRGDETPRSDQRTAHLQHRNARIPRPRKGDQ